MSKFISNIQWNLSITDTLGPDIFGHFLLQYSFSLSEVKNVFVTPVGTKIFVLIMDGGFFYCVLNSEGLLREVPLYFHLHNVHQGDCLQAPSVLITSGVMSEQIS